MGYLYLIWESEQSRKMAYNGRRGYIECIVMGGEIF